MGERILGLDLGITSIGWGVIDFDDENSKIIDSGVRIFTGAENPKDGSSLALPRREARGARRATKRKRIRIEKIKKLFIRNNLASYEDLFEKNNIYLQENKKDVWQLRDKGLKRKLEPFEFVRVLTHIGKHRGYKSNRKSEEEGNTEGKKVLSGIKNNKERMEANGYLTIGQMIYCESKKDRTLKRRNSKGDYSFSISREMLEDEVNKLFEKQIAYENYFATENLKKEFLDLAFTQKGLASIEKMVGKCIFEKKEKRAPKRSLSGEEFVTLTEIINNKILEEGEERGLTKTEIEKILDLCKQKKTVTYKAIRKELELPQSSLFKRVDYFDKNTRESLLPDLAEKEKFNNKMIGFHLLKSTIEKASSKITAENILHDKLLTNEITKVLTYEKNDEDLTEGLKEVFKKSKLSDLEKEKIIQVLVSKVSFNDFIH
ncbi:MAG: type II CRISPR RNA-guided endonuclease Cas9, partial [Campylobacterales bacterium]|nr:type II CRISPR RNA-guided endonuclease Cas9 [Campylobacterales bacterium]